MKIKYLEFLCITLLSLVKFYNLNSIRNSPLEIDDKSLGKITKVEGKMNINGEWYDTICDCDPLDSQRTESTPKCDPSKVIIHEERGGQGGSLEDVKTLMGNFHDLTFVEVPITSFKCLDGRNSKSVLGTPGGDAGEFILALGVYEAFIGKGKSLGQEDIDSILYHYLTIIPYDKFYMCTDDMAVAHLERELSMEGLNLHYPRMEMIPDLFNLISKPENIGDLHMKMMLKYPEQFAIRREIVSMFLKSFYKILWSKEDRLSKKLELEILTGDHRESAFIEIRSEKACISEQLAPLILTRNKSISVFVNHIDFVTIRRYQLANFFAEFFQNLANSFNPIGFFQKLNKQGLISLENTGSYIAKGLPFYTINLS